MNYFFFTYPLGHLAPFFTYLMVLPLVHLVESSELVKSPIFSASPAIEGITESNSVNSFCSFAFSFLAILYSTAKKLLFSSSNKLDYRDAFNDLRYRRDAAATAATIPTSTSRRST